MRVLIVEDDPDVGEVLSLAFGIQWSDSEVCVARLPARSPTVHVCLRGRSPGSATIQHDRHDGVTALPTAVY